MVAALPPFWQTAVLTLLAMGACAALVAVLIWTSGVEDI